MLTDDLTQATNNFFFISAELHSYGFSASVLLNRTTHHTFLYNYVGPPVFVKDNKRIQYVDIGKPMELMVYVQSWLNITNHSVATTLHDIKHLKVAIYHIKIKDTFHGQLIQLLGWKIVFRFPESTIDQLQNYTITISNELDSADYVTELKSKGNVLKT